MNEREHYLGHSSGASYAKTLAYEVVAHTPSGVVTRLGWVVEMDNGLDQVRSWAALAVISNTGDSFLGTFKTASQAIHALNENELALAKGRDHAEG